MICDQVQCEKSGGMFYYAAKKKRKGVKDELLNAKYPASNGCINYSLTAALCDFQSEKGTSWPQMEGFDGFSAWVSNMSRQHDSAEQQTTLARL